MKPTQLYTVSQKKGATFISAIILANIARILIILSLRLLRKVVLKRPPHLKVCRRTTLQNLNAQLYNFTRMLLNSIWCNNILFQ